MLLTKTKLLFLILFFLLIMEYSCSNCSFVTIVDSLLIKHVSTLHKNEAHTKVKCVFNGCGATFCKWKLFKLHISKIHPEKIGVLNADNINEHGDIVNVKIDPNEGIVYISI